MITKKNMAYKHLTSTILGKCNDLTMTSLELESVREIIPIAGRTLQLSEIWWFTQIIYDYIWYWLYVIMLLDNYMLDTIWQ